MILSSDERHLSRALHGKIICILKDNEFNKIRDALKAKQKELKRQGYGNCSGREGTFQTLDFTETSDSGLRTSDLELRTSDFGLENADFGFPTSYL